MGVFIMRSHPRAAYRSRLSRLPFLLTIALVMLLIGLPAAVFSADIPIATIPVGDSPVAVGVNPFSHRVYVANYYGNSVSVIDGTSDVVTATVPTGSWSIPIAVVANPVATPARAYVAEFWSNEITVIDETSNAASATITSNGVHAGGPRALALNPSGATPKLYAADYGAANISVFNAETYAPITTIGVGTQPRALGIFSSVPRTRIYVANRGSNTVSIIDGSTDTIVDTLSVGSAPKAIAVDTTTGYAYVTCEGSDSVVVIDDSDEITATVGVGDRPIGIAVDEAGGRVFVGNYNDGTVNVISTADFSVTATLTVGTQPWGIAYDTGDAKAFVTNYGSSNVSVINNALSVTNVATGYRPYAIAVDEGGTPHKAYSGNWGADNVTVIDEPLPPQAMRMLEVKEAFAAEDPVMVTIDSSIGSQGDEFFATGTATSVRSKYPSAMTAVFFRLAGEQVWRRASITSGHGSTEVSWQADLGILDAETVSLEVVALDQTSATASVSDGGTSIRAASFAGSAFATLDLVSEPAETVTEISASIPDSRKYEKIVLHARVSATDPSAGTPVGTVIFERNTSEGWAEEGRTELGGDGTAEIAIQKRPRGEYRALFLGSEDFQPSTSDPLDVIPGHGP